MSNGMDNPAAATPSAPDTAKVDAETKNVEAVTDDVAQDAQNTPDWRHNPEVGKTITAVKKEYEQKGYDKGYQAAKAELKPASPPMDGQFNAPQTHYQQPVPQQPSMTEAERAYQGRLLEVDQKGSSKYEDWVAKVAPLANRAPYDNKLHTILKSALTIPNGEDVIYELSKNPDALDSLKRIDPDYILEELIKLSAPKQKTVVKKTPPSPVEDIKAPPANGGGEQSYDDKKRAYRESKARNKYRR